jgi:hypothetical protein
MRGEFLVPLIPELSAAVRGFVAVAAEGITFIDVEMEDVSFCIGVRLEPSLLNTHWIEPIIKRMPKNKTIQGA